MTINNNRWQLKNAVFGHRFAIDFRYQSINCYRLPSIVIDCYRLSISLIDQAGLDEGCYTAIMHAPFVTRMLFGTEIESTEMAFYNTKEKVNLFFVHC